MTEISIPSSIAIYHYIKWHLCESLAWLMEKMIQIKQVQVKMPKKWHPMASKLSMENRAKEGLDHSPSFSLVDLHGQTQCHDASREIALCKLSLLYRKTGRSRGDRALAIKLLKTFCGSKPCLLVWFGAIFWADLSRFFLSSNPLNNNCCFMLEKICVI